MKVQLACLTLGLVKASKFVYSKETVLIAIDNACAKFKVPKTDCDRAKVHLTDFEVCSSSRVSILKNIVCIDCDPMDPQRGKAENIVKDLEFQIRPTREKPVDMDDLELLKSKYNDIDGASTVLDTAFVRLRYGYDQVEYMPFRGFLDSLSAADDDQQAVIREKYFRAVDDYKKLSAWYFLKGLHLRKRFPELPIDRAVKIIEGLYDDPYRVDVNEFIAKYEITDEDKALMMAQLSDCRATIADECKKNGIEDQSKTFLELIEKETVDVRKDIMQFLVGMRNKAQIETCAESFGPAIDPSGDPVDKVEDTEAISLISGSTEPNKDLRRIVKVARLRHKLNLDEKLTSIHAFLYAALFADDDQKEHWLKVLYPGDRSGILWVTSKARLLTILQSKGGVKVDADIEEANEGALYRFYDDFKSGSVINFIKKQVGARFQWEKSTFTLLITLRNGSTWKVVAEGMDMNTTDDKDEKKDDAKKSDNKSSDGGGSSGGGGGGSGSGGSSGGGGGGSGSGGSSGGGGGGSGGGGGGGGSSSSSSSSSSSGSSSSSSSTGANPSQSSTPSTDNSSAHMQVGWLLLAGVLAAL